MHKCEYSNLDHRRCSSAKQPPAVTSQSINSHKEGGAHECVSQLMFCEERWADLVSSFASFAALQMSLSDLLSSFPHMEINGLGLQNIFMYEIASTVGLCVLG